MEIQTNNVRGGATLQVTYPPSLVKAFSDNEGRSTIKTSLANFGHIQYGSTVIGNLQVASEDGCLPFKNFFNQNSFILVN